MRKIAKKSMILTIGVLTITMLTLIHNSPPAEAKDHYKSMSALMKHTKKGKDWQIHTNNEKKRTLIMAPHGGGIEPGTSEIAKEIAAKSDAAYYSFSGVRPLNNKPLHVTSANYDEPKARKMVKRSKRTIAIHKTAREGREVYLGGRDITLRKKIAKALSKKGFKVGKATGNIAGKDRTNIVNRNKKGAGVQLELSNSCVRSFYKDGNVSKPKRENTANETKRMHKFTKAVSEALEG